MDGVLREAISLLPLVGLAAGAFAAKVLEVRV